MFALVKGAMSDTTLVQPPLNVYPEAFLESTERYFNEVNRTEVVVQASIDPDRAKEVEALANALENDYGHLSRTVKYYRSLLNNERERKPYLHLGFLASGPSARQNLSAVQLGQAPLPPRPHGLSPVIALVRVKHVELQCS